MLTPQEIQEKTGSLEKAVFGGYSMSSVEDLLIPLQKDYASLYKENAVLKSKMKVLVDRLEEYRAKEESMNRAILTAQKTADDLMAETQRKCAAMVADSELRLRQRGEDLEKELQRAAQEAEQSKAKLQEEIQEERAKADKLRADLQRELQAEAQKAVKARTELHKEVLAENERVSLAKKAAASFIMEMEDRFQQQLSQLERIKQMDLKLEGTEPSGTKAAPAQKPSPKASPVSQDTIVRKRPQPPESDASRQPEVNLARVLAASAQAEDMKRPEVSGDTQVITPV